MFLFFRALDMRIWRPDSVPDGVALEVVWIPRSLPAPKTSRESSDRNIASSPLATMPPTSASEQRFRPDPDERRGRDSPPTMPTPDVGKPRPLWLHHDIWDNHYNAEKPWNGSRGMPSGGSEFNRSRSEMIDIPPRVIFRMRDRSLGGRLRRMARRADCAELRDALRSANNSSADVIVRTMAERGCM
jgi:hypothetical protein